MRKEIRYVNYENTAYEVKTDAISAASSGDNELLAAQGAGKSIIVLSWDLVCSDAVTVRFESNNDSDNFLTGAYSFAANGGISSNSQPFCFKTNANESLNMILGGAVAVAGSLTYVVVE